MKVIHIMADGSRRESVEGIVIENERFYQVINEIQRKKDANK